MKAIVAGAALAAMTGCAGVTEASAALVTESLTLSTDQGDYTITSLPMNFSDTFKGTIAGFTGLQNGYIHVNEADNLVNFTVSAESRQADYCEGGVCGPVYHELFAQFELTPTATVQEGSSFTTGFYDSDNINNIGYEGIEGYDTFYRQYFYVNSVTFSVTQTPLPASAPMFGAALLGLAGFGYTVKRKARAAA